jgi:hypothetical protein
VLKRESCYRKQIVRAPDFLLWEDRILVGLLQHENFKEAIPVEWPAIAGLRITASRRRFTKMNVRNFARPISGHRAIGDVAMN